MSATIDIALLPAFIEVVRQGSFTAAARALQVPKSTVSRRVSRLEDQLGVQLLVRTTRKLRLTEEGRAYYARVATAVEQVEEAGREVQEVHEEPHGELKIAVPSDLEPLPEVITSFLVRYPRVTVDVRVSGERADLVGEGFDLAVRAGRLQDSSLVARQLAKVSFHLFASEDYLRAHGAPQALEDLSDHRCVVHRAVQGAGRWHLVGRGQDTVLRVKSWATSDDLAFVAGLIRAGAGVGLTPERMFEGEPRVSRVLPDYQSPSGAVYLVYPGARHVPAKVRAFRDHLLEHGSFG